MEKDIFFVLHGIFKKMRKIADRELFAFNITNTEMRILNMIYFYDADGCTQDDFSANIEIDRTNIGRSLNKLEKLGYIRKIKDEKDRRTYRIFLTEKGQAIKEQLLKIRENIKKTFKKDMSTKEVDNLKNLLNKVDLNLSEENFNEIKNHSYKN